MPLVITTFKNHVIDDVMKFAVICYIYGRRLKSVILLSDIFRTEEFYFPVIAHPLVLYLALITEERVYYRLHSERLTAGTKRKLIFGNCSDYFL